VESAEKFRAFERAYTFFFHNVNALIGAAE